MDIATVLGLVIMMIAVLGSILVAAPLGIFVDIPSVLVVGLGVVGTTLAKFPMEKVKEVVKIAMKTIFYTPAEPKPVIEEIVKLAETARKESVFALEKVQVSDPFMSKAMKLAADNRPPEVISAILQLEIDAMAARHQSGVDMMDNIAADGPAMGMIGTLIGLVIMLQNLSDPNSIGPAMAVALLTTFYGAILANVFANPFKVKLKIRSVNEVTKMNIIVAGTLGIVAGENPRLIKEKIDSFVPPGDRQVEGSKE